MILEYFNWRNREEKTRKFYLFSRKFFFIFHCYQHLIEEKRKNQNFTYLFFKIIEKISVSAIFNVHIFQMAYDVSITKISKNIRF